MQYILSEDEFKKLSENKDINTVALEDIKSFFEYAHIEKNFDIAECFGKDITVNIRIDWNYVPTGLKLLIDEKLRR